jgi:hypothetical protein
MLTDISCASTMSSVTNATQVKIIGRADEADFSGIQSSLCDIGASLRINVGLIAMRRLAFLANNVKGPVDFAQNGVTFYILDILFNHSPVSH